MMKKYALAVLVAVSLLGCGDDDEKTLIKWSCSGSDCSHSRACAASQSEALSASGCSYSSSYGSPKCTPLGDVCACPDGASSCGIASGN